MSFNMLTDVLEHTVWTSGAVASPRFPHSGICLSFVSLPKRVWCCGHRTHETEDTDTRSLIYIHCKSPGNSSRFQPIRMGNELLQIVQSQKKNHFMTVFDSGQSETFACTAVPRIKFLGHDHGCKAFYFENYLISPPKNIPHGILKCPTCGT